MLPRECIENILVRIGSILYLNRNESRNNKYGQSYPVSLMGGILRMQIMVSCTLSVINIVYILSIETTQRDFVC